MMKYEDMSLVQLAEEMMKQRELSDQYKELAGTRYARWDELRKIHLPKRMEEMGIESTRLAGIGTVSLRVDAFCTVPAGKKDELYSWLESNEFGDLITATVNSSTLKAWMKEQIMGGNPVPEAVNYTPYTYATITKG